MSHPTQQAYENGYNEARLRFEPVVESLKSEKSQLNKCVDDLMLRIIDLNKTKERLEAELAELTQKHKDLQELYEEDSAYCELCGCVPHYCECDE